MGDIVERLRFLGSGEPFRGALMCEAADEIERLRAELAAAKRNSERLQGLIDEHNAACISRCGDGEQEAVACGYRPYFVNNGRRCPTCPRDEMIDIAP